MLAFHVNQTSPVFGCSSYGACVDAVWSCTGHIVSLTNSCSSTCLQICLCSSFSLISTLVNHCFPLTPSIPCACQKFRVVVIMTKAAPPASHTQPIESQWVSFSKPVRSQCLLALSALFLDNPAYDGDMIRHKCRFQPKCNQTNQPAFRFLTSES